MLYPLKFQPLCKERIWGGHKIQEILGQQYSVGDRTGECWELSAVQGSISVVSNGYLKGNNIEELVEVYMGDLVGDKVYQKYGLEFPVLIKLIDASDILSIQVHPDDELARKRHNAYGKTEMWYVVGAAPGACIYLGFKEGIDKEQYLKHFNEGTISEIINKFEVKEGQAYFIPPGTMHVIGKGVMLFEVQQTSDITYRVFDWNRIDKDGKGRDLHTELALDALNFNLKPQDFPLPFTPVKNEPVRIKKSPHFASDLLWLDGALERDYYQLDSFVAYVCLEGSADILFDEGKETIRFGETVLIPAELKNITLQGKAKIMEVYVP